MTLLLLHHNWHLIDQCCDLINSEWPRSKTSRLRSLETSCDDFPTNVLLLQQDRVIGHCKLTCIPSLPDACFLESVVIQHAVRGTGLGKLLMLLTEEYIGRRGLSTVYLSTLDKQQFYKKLGYVECKPVSIYGFSFPTSAMVTRGDGEPPTVPYIAPPSPSFAPPPPPPPPSFSLAPPPPPPPPTLHLGNQSMTPKSVLQPRKTFMIKEL